MDVNNLKPDYNNMGFAITLGPKLKEYVERELIRDLNEYNYYCNEYRFDWSESCVEGEDIAYLDGITDRFSGISIYDEDDKLKYTGWMDFIYVKETDNLIIYWLFLNAILEDKKVRIKNKVGIPKHIYERLSHRLKQELKSKVI